MKHLLLIILLLPVVAQAQLTATQSPTILGTFSLHWTAPGDDSLSGTANRYDMRYAPDSLTLIGWVTATVVPNMPTPAIAGTIQSVNLILNDNQTYYFAIKAVDENGNISPISNIVRIITTDTIPPARIIDLRTP